MAGLHAATLSLRLFDPYAVLSRRLEYGKKVAQYGKILMWMQATSNARWARLGLIYGGRLGATVPASQVMSVDVERVAYTRCTP
jgi:hypothetical protein